MISVNQVTMISLEELMPEKHNYRKFKEVFYFRKIDYSLYPLSKNPAINKGNNLKIVTITVINKGKNFRIVTITKIWFN